jgi:uncharacterized protein (TIGR03435 family)
MGNHPAVGTNSRSKCSFTFALTAAFVAIVFVVAAAAVVRAQASKPNPKTPTAQLQAVPQWQIDAGGKMEFDVASVKQDTATPSQETVKSNIPFGPRDAFTPTGGLLSATNISLLTYMIFAYKITPNRAGAVADQLPKWAAANRYDIQARAAGNPTKDQFRLMMQALLADRFKLTVHYETRQLPVFALVLDKPGKLGPQLQMHSEDVPCSRAAPTAGTAMPTVASGLPQICGGAYGLPPSSPGRVRAGARDMALAEIGTTFIFTEAVGVDRPVVDGTGLAGKYDFAIEWTPEINGPLPPGVNFQPDPSGPTFLQALKEQLGLKLDPQTGRVDVLVIDHVEEPSQN